MPYTGAEVATYYKPTERNFTARGGYKYRSLDPDDAFRESVRDAIVVAVVIGLGVIWFVTRAG